MGGLAALAKKDYWQARPRLTLTYHIFFVFKQVSGVGGLAALAKRDTWQESKLVGEWTCMSVLGVPLCV